MTKKPPYLFLTRAAEDSQAVVNELNARQSKAFDPIVAPLIGYTPVGALPDMAPFQGLVFTSRNGVRAYVDRGGPRLPVYAVGQATRHAAEAEGFSALSANGAAEDLIDWLAILKPSAPLLHIRGRHGRGDVAARLTAAGVPSQMAILYDQPALPLPERAQGVLTGRHPVVVPLYSPRTATLFTKTRVSAPLLVAAMSEAVAKAAAPLHSLDLKVAGSPDSQAMAQTISELLDRAHMLEAARREV